MIKLNFIPQGLRKKRGNLWLDGIGPLPREAILGSLVAAAGVLFVVHVVLAGLAVMKITQHTMLQVRWGSLGAEKKIFDDITKETKVLQTKMISLKAITSAQGLVWAKLLNDVSDSVPKGIWLRNISFQQGVLIIDGSAVSRMKDEMIQVNNFVAMLKEKPSFQDGFVGIDVDSIERRDNTVLSIADFSVKAKRKTP